KNIVSIFGTFFQSKATAAPDGGRGQTDYSLHLKLWIGTGIVTICTIILAAGLLLRTYDDFITARRNLHDLSDYRLLLD
ncbi:hypothetical protein, partial [Klebsiella pneumoniae]|uniref:hypothetical protein n=1 Tax=Klebsiella pneumoniae TaxID=573 RepID=UPI0013D07599